MADGWKTGRNQSITPCLASKCHKKYIKKRGERDFDAGIYQSVMFKSLEKKFREKLPAL